MTDRLTAAPQVRTDKVRWCVRHGSVDHIEPGRCDFAQATHLPDWNNCRIVAAEVTWTEDGEE